eukprot:CAMPEP_0170523062 /NCGR_PEP_ID=MMETSP0209-20121228/8461_1 /TAXON_ID=665100 ORGANISM="Litonotus pictus, Strain P1" /NCGR_SAMPLE_ID=MMETSP0209 /ASSEMBLY_ACC=CAM_ASM_000301 /LENGTH=405 /DNA_ID=CAMNT_0010810907 /DNA_START=1314 /DNA_END=2528 /DNA_ORIENTATION=+
MSFYRNRNKSILDNSQIQNANYEKLYKRNSGYLYNVVNTINWEEGEERVESSANTNSKQNLELIHTISDIEEKGEVSEVIDRSLYAEKEEGTMREVNFGELKEDRQRNRSNSVDYFNRSQTEKEEKDPQVIVESKFHPKSSTHTPSASPMRVARKDTKYKISINQERTNSLQEQETEKTPQDYYSPIPKIKISNLYSNKSKSPNKRFNLSYDFNNNNYYQSNQHINQTRDGHNTQRSHNTHFSNLSHSQFENRECLNSKHRSRNPLINIINLRVVSNLSHYNDLLLNELKKKILMLNIIKKHKYFNNNTLPIKKKISILSIKRDTSAYVTMNNIAQFSDKGYNTVNLNTSISPYLKYIKQGMASKDQNNLLDLEMVGIISNESDVRPLKRHYRNTLKNKYLDFTW